jgi:thiamine monophosphate synthase
MLPERAWISIACHDAEAVRQPHVDGVLLSPVAAPRKGRDALGFGALRAARRALVSVGEGAEPALYALGGIQWENARQALADGADGVAVIGAVFDGRDPMPLLDALGIRAP